MPAKKDPRLARAGVTGYNKPKRTPNHPKKSHVVVAKEGDKIKTIRYGEQGAKTAGKPKAGEPEAMKKNVLVLKHDTARTLPKVRCQRPIGPINLSGNNRRILCHTVKVHTVVK